MAGNIVWWIFWQNNNIFKMIVPVYKSVSPCQEQAVPHMIRFLEIYTMMQPSAINRKGMPLY